MLPTRFTVLSFLGGEAKKEIDKSGEGMSQLARDRKSFADRAQLHIAIKLLRRQDRSAIHRIPDLLDQFTYTMITETP